MPRTIVVGSPRCPLRRRAVESAARAAAKNPHEPPGAEPAARHPQPPSSPGSKGPAPLDEPLPDPLDEPPPALLEELPFASQTPAWQTRFRLYSLDPKEGGTMRRLETFALADEEGELLREPRASARGAIMVVASGRRIYRIDVREIGRSLP